MTYSIALEDISVDSHKIFIKFPDKNQYLDFKEKILASLTNTNLMLDFQYYLLDVEMQLIFTKANNSEIFYENCEHLFRYLSISLHLIPKQIFNLVLNKALLILNSANAIFLLPNQRKFLLTIESNNLILSPIYQNEFTTSESLLEYYKKLFSFALGALEGFIRSRIHIVNNKIIIEYNDAIDQVFYIFKKIITSPKLFEQNFNPKEYLNQLLCFIIKYIASAEVQNLRIGVECSYDHPLNSHRYLSLITYKLFSRLAENGRIDKLNQNEIIQLADAFSYENIFSSAPSLIINSYNRLCKALPFKLLEKILKKQKITECSF